MVKKFDLTYDSISTERALTKKKNGYKVRKTFVTK